MSTLNYSTSTMGLAVECTLIWTIPMVSSRFENGRDKIERLRSTDAHDLKPDIQEYRLQVKINFSGRNCELIEIYYLSPNPVFIKSLILSTKLGRNVFDHRQLDTNVQENKWHYLGTVMRNNVINFGLNLNLKYVITKTINDNRCIDLPDLQLIEDLEILLENGLFSDVTMKSVEQSEYKVHRAILGSRSVVLKSYFMHNTTECINNIVESQFESEVLREVLTFIYSDKAPRVDEMPEKLLEAADYYQLNGLKGLCEKALHKKLKPENAIEILQLADLHSAKTLKTMTLEFIRKAASVITKTEGWANLVSVKLIKKICERVAADDSDGYDSDPDK